MAFVSYFIWCSIVIVAFLLGLTPAPLYFLVVCQSGILVSNISIYAIIRTGFNKKFKDPSLTLLQILVATFWIMTVLYYAGSLRSGVIILYFIVFVFGLFKLKVREFLFLSFFAVVNYAAIIFLLYINHPESINMKTEVLNLVTMAMVLPWFSVVGGYITKLKAKISNALSTIKQMTDNIHDVIFVLDMNLKYTYVSPSVKILRGYEPEEVLKQTPFDAITSSSLDLALKTLSEVMELKKIEHEEDISRTLQLEVKRKDGTIVYTETKFSFIRDKNQRPLGILGVVRDITDRKQMESQREALLEALRKSEEKYRTILENMQEGYFEVDLAGNFTFFNDSVCRDMGYPKDELMSMNNQQYIDKEELKKVFEAYNKVYKTGEPNKGFGWQITRKDGAKRYIEASISLQKDSLGKPTGFKGISRDITERKRMEEKLRFEEQRFRAFVEHSSDIIVLLNLEGVITYVNPVVESVLGFKPEERIGAKGFERIHPDDVKFLSDAFNILSSDISSPVMQRELRLRHKDGSWRSLEAVGSNLVNNNVVEAIIVNYRDITERKRAEESLKETEIKFRTIFDSASDGILLLNIGDQKFSDANEKICNMLGYTKKELLGLGIKDIHPQESIPFVIAQSEKLLKKEISVAKNIPVIRKDKTMFFADISASMITLGEKEYLLGMFRDISERKQAEEALRKSEQTYLELSIIDDLTQLYNSRHFYAQLEREIERSNRYEQPLTLLLLDLDKFKAFNDTYGHVDGDYVLSRLGQVIKRCLRETDSAYRYGGEEFTIMLPMTTSEEGIVTAKRIQAELRKEAFSPVVSQKIYMTVSIGLAQYKPKEEMRSFVHRVDQLMYQAKKNGRDMIFPESERQEQFKW